MKNRIAVCMLAAWFALGLVTAANKKPPVEGRFVHHSILACVT